MVEPFPTYEELKRSHGGFTYGLYLLIKALYEQVNSVEEPVAVEEPKKKAGKPKKE